MNRESAVVVTTTARTTSNALSSNDSFGAWASSLIYRATAAAQQVVSFVAQRPAAAIIALLVALHLFGLTQPLLGHFSTKQAVYGSIARNWARGIAPSGLPTLDEIRGDGRSYHLLEWPLTAWVAGKSWAACGGDLGVWGRGWSVVWTCAALLLFHDWLRRRFDPRTALGGLMALGFAPVLLIYGHAFQTEASLLALTAGTLWSFDRWLASRRLRWLLTCGLCAALMLVTKIYLAALIVPLVGWLAASPRTRANSLAADSQDSLALESTRGVGEDHPAPPSRDPRFWLVALLATVPAALWYGFAYFASTGLAGVDPERLYYTVRDSAGAHAFPHPLLFDPGCYKRWLDVFFGVGLTPIGATLCLWGALQPAARSLRWWLASVVLLLVLLPRKFYDMDYYWVALLPPLAAAAGVGWAALTRDATARATFALGAIWLALGLRFALPPAYTIPPEDRAVIAAGEAVQATTAPQATIVSLHGACPDLLYYCDRAGWIWPAHDDPVERQDVALARRRLDDYAANGARCLVVADLTQLDRLPGLSTALAAHPVLAGGPHDDFIVVALGPAIR